MHTKMYMYIHIYLCVLYIYFIKYIIVAVLHVSIYGMHVWWSSAKLAPHIYSSIFYFLFPLDGLNTRAKFIIQSICRCVCRLYSCMHTYDMCEWVWKNRGLTKFSGFLCINELYIAKQENYCNVNWCMHIYFPCTFPAFLVSVTCS